MHIGCWLRSFELDLLLYGRCGKGTCQPLTILWILREWTCSIQKDVFQSQKFIKPSNYTNIDILLILLKSCMSLHPLLGFSDSPYLNRIGSTRNPFRSRLQRNCKSWRNSERRKGTSRDHDPHGRFGGFCERFVFGASEIFFFAISLRFGRSECFCYFFGVCLVKSTNILSFGEKKETPGSHFFGVHDFACFFFGGKLAREFPAHFFLETVTWISLTSDVREIGRRDGSKWRMRAKKNQRCPLTKRIGICPRV